MHLAETISLIVWNPETGEIDEDVPSPSSPLNLRQFAENFYPHYADRYKGLPPHDAD
jgi:hypothetical protein